MPLILIHPPPPAHLAPLPPILSVLWPPCGPAGLTPPPAAAAAAGGQPPARGLLREIQIFVVGFLSSLLPGFQAPVLRQRNEEAGENNNGEERPHQD